MWTFLGSWIFVFLGAVVAGAALLSAARHGGRAVLALATGAFLVVTVAFVSLLVAPTTVDSGVECGTTIGSTNTKALDQMTADDLAAAGEDDYSDDCRHAARQRYGLIVVSYLIALGALGGAVTRRAADIRRPIRRDDPATL